ncbi:bifunctional ADP-dependent NAD(P)H-hydrate dehydratase/NAD(P)H-hydrate epimerase [Chryseobacterium indologenes]|uniref:Bifunctional NAD(P)H-hydrate repair enzyme n=1 Tax=Chryseobacterium indologenes TaxID=253 RepID=A0A0N0IXI9_CHRID|nr:bifunctional ADP-dependent NAD(P)H-hydrate dehydratase/NAD(P)H-hydrate epimerase [Chryseobacterium indologenes]KPE52321.1 sugar kinase [Chryseobacterium indologenes]
MKIFTAEQIRQWDQLTVSRESITSLKLMERAALALAGWISENCKNYTRLALFCGPGNNGGDGFAAARILYTKGFDVEVFVPDIKAEFSEDASVNLQRLKDFSGISVRELSGMEEYSFDDETVIIDALFGTGLSRPLDGIYKKLVSEINEKKGVKISVDIPSGLSADSVFTEDTVVFKADYTLSFQCWKKSFLHPETGKYTGKVIVLDIGLSPEFREQENSEDYVTDQHVISRIFKPREEFSHKGTYGKVTIVGGSYGKIGAAVLSTRAALKTGAGLTFTLAPDCGYIILQTACPEAMFIKGGTEYIENIGNEENSVYGIGPGLGTHEKTRKALLDFLKQYSSPVVLDADALNMLSENQESLKYIPEKSIITPHPKEFERLFGSTANSFERLEQARKKAGELNIYIILKDHHTQVVTPEGRVFYNITGNAGLAKGGSGDILTGILASLLAQGYSTEEACLLGVWLHGKAADLAAEKYAKESMLPTDVINELGSVFGKLNRKKMKL